MKIAMTGGHHSSALPIIQKLKSKDKDIEIYWFGHKFTLKGDRNPTLEYHEINDLGISFINLNAGKVYKTFDIASLLKIPYGFFEALFYLAKCKPDIILSFGGYLAVPVVIAGWFLNIPSITHEQTLVTGYANRVVSLFAKKILISWRSSEKFFPKEKVLYTGIPLRHEIFDVNSSAFDVDNNLPTIYITAGKTGSHKINESLKESLKPLLEVCNVIHQCGDFSENNDFDGLKNLYESLTPRPSGKFFLKKFVVSDEIGEAFSKADVVVTRSGAHIMSELLALKKPCILIPIPWVSHNEQFKNAEFLKNVGLGYILEEKDLNSQNFISSIKHVLANLNNFYIKDENLKNLRNDASDLIVEQLYLYAKR